MTTLLAMYKGYPAKTTGLGSGRAEVRQRIADEIRKDGMLWHNKLLDKKDAQ